MRNKTKTVKCCNPDCKKEITVNINVSTYGTVCKECVDKGFKSPFRIKSKITREKTCIDKYGVSSVAKLKEITDKKLATNLNKYGGTGFQNKDLGEKSKMKMIEKYGVDNIMKCDQGINLLKKSMIEKYGVDNILRDPSVAKIVSEKLKGKESKLKGKNYEKIFGEEKAKSLRNEKSKKEINKFLPQLKRALELVDLELLDNEYHGAHIKHNFLCKKCNKPFVQIWNALQQGFKCPNCFPRFLGVSKGEKEVCDFIKSLNFEIIERSKNILRSGKELDIFIPMLNIAFEYNGLYWHSEERNSDKNYHLNKTKECLENKIRLIHIFEDEWAFKNEITKHKIINVLKCDKSEKIYARKCVIKEISHSDKNNFLDKFHIQGKDVSEVNLGAFYDHKLISVMTFSYGNLSKGSKKKEKVFELSRFCSDYNYRVIGVAGKLFTYFKRNYEWNEIFSYADRRWSQGNLYYKLGFELEKETDINYWYVQNFKRVHRFKFRKRLDESKDMSESLLRFSEGLVRIWDCGNLKFILKNEKL